MIKSDGSMDHFRIFGASLEGLLSSYGEMTEAEVVARQKEQVKELVGLEEEFRLAVWKHKSGPAVYGDFASYVRDRRKNILVARPYFRVRQETFVSEISPALRDGDAETLARFHGNWNLISFVVGGGWDADRVSLLVPPRSVAGTRRVKNLVAEVSRVRQEIVELNLPFCIARARKFWSRTPRSHLELMDLVQTCGEGLMAAVDKFVLPPPGAEWKFAAVAFGRMTGYLIGDYSETLVHFFPQDKRKLYRANKAVGKFYDSLAEVDFEKLAEAVNRARTVDEETGEVRGPETTPAELAGLMSAASTVSADAPRQDGEDLVPPRGFRAPDSVRPDVQAEEREARRVMAMAMSMACLETQKFCYLKGVEIYLDEEV